MTDPHPDLSPPRRLTLEEAADPQRKRRNRMTALALAAFAATIMTVTAVRLSQNIKANAALKQQEAARVATDSGRP